MIRVFFDANVIFAASDSTEGAAHLLVRLSRQGRGITLVATEYTIDEAERNLQIENPEALTEFYKVREQLSVGPEPSEELMKGLNARLPDGIRLPNKDLPVLGGAIVAGADWLVTHDRDHFGPLYGRTVCGVVILRPGPALRRLKGSIRRAGR